MNRNLLTRFRWPLLLSLLVIVLTGRASSIVDSFEKTPPAGTTLDLPASYVAMSPISRTLDLLSLLSIPQTVWLFAVVALLVVAQILLTRSVKRRRLWVRLALGIAGVIAPVAVLEAAAVFLPRQMANLRVSGPQTLRVDFHSHTNSSHDANQRFTPADNREWHQSGGFDVAYISDHVRFAGAAEAMRSNPARAGQAFVSLSAVEGRYHKILSTIMLGLTEADTTVIDDKGHLLPGTPSSGQTPVTIVAIPNGNIDSVTTESLDSLPHFAGMELVDAAPRGLGQLDREEEKIRSIASNGHLMLVSASNNHGWGRTVVAWNLMTIPGWRDLAPDSLAKLIEKPFRERQTNAVTVVKRLRPRAHGLALPFTLPIALAQILGSLTIGERGVWLVWIWGVTLIALLLRGRRPAASHTA